MIGTVGTALNPSLDVEYGSIEINSLVVSLVQLCSVHTLRFWLILEIGRYSQDIGRTLLRL